MQPYLGLSESADDVTFKAASCSVSRELTIVETPVTGRNGTIKESVGAEDYNVTLEVYVVSDTDEYPSDAVSAVIKLMNSSKSLYVDSDYLRLFDITRLTPMKYDLQEQQTFSNAQHMSLTFVSDDEYEVEVEST